jgi:proteasome lid subunit RPN8/RPN11
MKIRGIRRNLIRLMLEIGREHHPNEFVALLREKAGVIHELDLLPGTIGGEDSATLYIEMMPLDTHIVGSAHSHPNGVLRPSGADIGFFPRTGQYHFIVGYPYEEEDWRCFHADGSLAAIEVIG